MTRMKGASALVAAALVAATVFVIPGLALAQLYPGWDKPVGSNTTSAPYKGYGMPIPSEGGEEPQENLTPEDLAFLAELKNVAKGFSDILDKVNPVASNEGAQEFITGLAKRRDDLLMLSKRLTPDGKRISMFDLKRMFAEGGKNATGPEVTKRLAETAANLKNAKWWTALEEMNVLNRASQAANILDPGSKALGAMWEGDYDGAVVHVVSGTCKYGVTTAAAGVVVGAFAAGTAPITVPVVIGSAVAAGVATYGYDTYIQPFFDDMNQALANAKAKRSNIDFEVLNAYKDVKLANRQSATEAITDFIQGKKSSDELKALLHPVRDKLHERTQLLEAKKAENHAAALDAMHEIASKHPELADDIALYEQGKLANRDAIPLLKALQDEYGDPCKEEANRDFVIQRLGKLGYERVIQLPEVQDADAADKADFYQCMCHSYSTMGTGISYHPGETKDCQNSLPCKGGNWGCAAYDLPSSPKAWVRCIAKLTLYPEYDADGNKVPETGMRLDEYFATAKSVRDQVLEARKKAAVSKAE